MRVRVPRRAPVFSSKTGKQPQISPVFAFFVPLFLLTPEGIWRPAPRTINTIFPRTQNKNRKICFPCLTFCRMGSKLAVGTALRDLRKAGSGLITNGFFSKSTCKPTKFQKSLLLLRMKWTSKDHCVFMSCWAFLLRLRSRFLVGPTCTRTGIRPAFLSPDGASCAGNRKTFVS